MPQSRDATIDAPDPTSTIPGATITLYPISLGSAGPRRARLAGAARVMRRAAASDMSRARPGRRRRGPRGDVASDPCARFSLIALRRRRRMARHG